MGSLVHYIIEKYYYYSYIVDDHLSSASSSSSFVSCSGASVVEVVVDPRRLLSKFLLFPTAKALDLRAELVSAGFSVVVVVGNAGFELLDRLNPNVLLVGMRSRGRGVVTLLLDSTVVLLAVVGLALVDF